MKNILKSSLIILLGFSPLLADVGTVCKWDSNKKAAVVLSFDDWSPGHYPIVVPELKKRNINATFYVIAKTSSKWDEIQEAANNGNEIGNHTKTHPDLTSKTAEEKSDEIRAAKELIDKNIATQTVSTLAYPFGNYNDEVIDSIISSGHIASRTVNSPTKYGYDFASTEGDYQKIKTFGMQTSTTTDKYFGAIAKVIDGGGLLTYMYHSVDDADGTYGDSWYEPVVLENFQAQLDTLKSVEDKVWITTMANAVKYHREAKCATIIEKTAFDGSNWVLELTDTLSNNTLFNQPLTVKVATNGNKFLQLTQNGAIVSIDSPEGDSIMFKAIPDGGDIVLSTTATSVLNIKSEHEFKVYPNPAQDFISVEFQTDIENATVEILNASENIVTTMLIKNSKKITVDIRHLEYGVYTLLVKSKKGNSKSSFYIAR